MMTAGIMKQLLGILCSLFLLLASAAWVLEKCQSLAAHHDGHEHSDSASHARNHDLDMPREQSSPEDPVIHCVSSGESPSFISSPSPRIARLVITEKILPSFFVPVADEATGQILHSEKRPPGSFFPSVSPYLALSVLRI